jgi:hypothetical protein
MNSNDWWSLFIGIAVVVGAYYYLTNATAEREKEMALFQKCIEENDIEYGTETIDKIMAKFDAEESNTGLSDEESEAIDDENNRYINELLTKCGDE